MSLLIAEDQFAIRAPPERVYKILGSVILRSLPLERMDILDENNFSAVLRVPFAFFNLWFNLRGVLEVDAPKSMVCLLQAESRWKVVGIKLKVDFTLTPDGPDRTLIHWSVSREANRRNMIELFLAKKEKTFTEDILYNIRKSLEQLA